MFSDKKVLSQNQSGNAIFKWTIKSCQLYETKAKQTLEAVRLLSEIWMY